MLQIVTGKNARGFSFLDMKQLSSKLCSGFTLVELLVVMAIMGVMMTMAAGVLRDAGKGRGIESGVDLLEGMVQEARATAMGNDTYTRVIIASDERDTGPDSRHLRYIAVQRFVKSENSAGTYDGSNVAQDGKWVRTSAGVMLPPGVFFSPTYSSPLGWKDGSGGSMIGQEVTSLSRKGLSRVYYIEFDEKGRFVAPGADPLNPTRDQRLVLISGQLDRTHRNRRAKDGVIPSALDARKRPAVAKGILVSPNGEVSLLRTTDQVFED